MNKSAKRIDRKEIFQGKIFAVAEDTIEFPNGTKAKSNITIDILGLIN